MRAVAAAVILDQPEETALAAPAAAAVQETRLRVVLQILAAVVAALAHQAVAEMVQPEVPAL
jgi:hypothetical protein